jgi:hypothetical protein
MLSESRLTNARPSLTMVSMTEMAHSLLSTMGEALGDSDPLEDVVLSGEATLPSAFHVSDLAQASVAAAGRALASAWFASSIRPIGWELPPVWDSVAGDYPAGDGWIRLHTNAPRHRAAALAVLGVPEDRKAVAAAVAGWPIEELEAAVVAAGGAAAAMWSLESWSRHPQGCAVAAEPLLHARSTSPFVGPVYEPASPERPLAGVRVLDLTRVLAGPVATRLLAGWGAQVLRIDPPDWDEPAIAPEVTLGKRCARLDLRGPGGNQHLLDLLSSADVLVHGYRSDALEGLGLGEAVRDARRPGLIDVSLDAYGWTGPWRTRRGFDSLIQMSSGIADAGRTATGSDGPVPLPVQALDQATGYLLAAAAIAGLTRRLTDGTGSRWRASLARTALLLVGAGMTDRDGREDRAGLSISGVGPVESTAWGPARRIPVPLEVQGAPLRWSVAARPLGSDSPRWTGA